MKMISSTLAAVFALSLPFTALASESLCIYDLHDIWAEITKWDSITTQNGYQMQVVENAQDSGLDGCVADCFSYGYPFVCIWEKGNWGETIFAR